MAAGDSMELDLEEVGRRIAKRRKHLGIKQNELATKLNISNNHLSGIETGKAGASLEVLMSICTILKVTPDYLLMGTIHSSNVPQNIIGSLRLCSTEDVQLLAQIVLLMVDRNAGKWNVDISNL